MDVYHEKKNYIFTSLIQHMLQYINQLVWFFCRVVVRGTDTQLAPPPGGGGGGLAYTT